MADAANLRRHEGQTEKSVSLGRHPATSGAPARPSMLITQNQKGEFTISQAVSEMIERTFLGSNTKRESAPQDSDSLEFVRLAQVIGTLPEARGKSATPKTVKIALSGVAALAPRDGMEVMLCSQLVALHGQSMEFLRRGMLLDQTVDGVDSNVNRSTKLLRTFATMAECLRTYRGGGQQKMTVEHVTVQAGGQAIVGTVHRSAGVGMQNKTENEPHAKRRGWLRNGNPPGNPSDAPRCGARTRKGLPCGSPAIRGRNRCRMHGGLSTGPRTKAGLARSKQARWKHGRFSAEARQEAARLRVLLRECKEMAQYLLREEPA